MTSKEGINLNAQHLKGMSHFCLAHYEYISITKKTLLQRFGGPPQEFPWMMLLLIYYYPSDFRGFSGLLHWVGENCLLLGKVREAH